MPVDCCYDNFQSVIIYRLRFHREYIDSYPDFAISGGTWAVYPQRLQVEIVKIFG